MGTTDTAVIRPARERDLPALQEIYRLSWEGQGGDWLLEQAFGVLGDRPWYDWGWRTIARKFADHPEWVFVVESEDRVVGFACLAVDPRKSLGIIGYNAVHPDHRGAGLGSLQLDNIMAELRARDLRHVEVIVTLNEGHRAARRQYDRLACEPLGVMEFRYGRLNPEAIDPPDSDSLTVRPARLADGPQLENLVRRALEGWHMYSRVQEEYGALGGVPWHRWVWQEIAGGLTDVLVAEREGRLEGALVCRFELPRRIASLVYNLTDPARPEVEEFLVAAATRRWATQGLEILGTGGLTDHYVRSTLSPALTDRLGLDEVVMQSEYRFRNL